MEDIGDRSRHAFLATKYKKDVLRTGVEGTALITALEYGGRSSSSQSLVYFEMSVTVPGKEPYDVATGEYVTMASAGSVAPGRELVVKVDPNDGSRVAVDWDRTLRLR